MEVAPNVFKKGEKSDFDRMLDDILGRVKTTALHTSAQVKAEAAARGSLLSSGTPIDAGTKTNTAATRAGKTSRRKP